MGKKRKNKRKIEFALISIPPPTMCKPIDIPRMPACEIYNHNLETLKINSKTGKVLNYHNEEIGTASIKDGQIIITKNK